MSPKPINIMVIISKQEIKTQKQTEGRPGEDSRRRQQTIIQRKRLQSPTLTKSWSETSSLLNYEKINLLVKPLSVVCLFRGSTSKLQHCVRILRPIPNASHPCITPSLWIWVNMWVWWDSFLRFVLYCMAKGAIIQVFLI